MRILQKQVPHESTVDFKCLIAIEMQISCSTQNHNESILFDHIWQERISNKLSNRISALIAAAAAAAAAAFHSNTLVPSSDVAHTSYMDHYDSSLPIRNALQLQKCVCGVHISFQLISERQNTSS